MHGTVSREYRILWAGRHRRSDWESLCEGYRERIARFQPIHDVPVKVRTGSEDPRRRQMEAEALLAATPDPGWTIALDVRGRSLSSEKFAAQLSRIREDWPHPVCFWIGSDLGLDPDLTDRARLVLSLGPMVFGHELARLMLYEQIYRAVSMETGISYHRS